MVNTNRRVLTKDWSALARWASETSGIPEVRVQVRLRGNHLHLLWEAPQCPDKEELVERFAVALTQTPWESLLPANSPPVYQMFLCGRTQGHRRPDWTMRLDYHGTMTPSPPSDLGTEEAPTLTTHPELAQISPNSPQLVGVTLVQHQETVKEVTAAEVPPPSTSRLYLQALLQQTPLTEMPDLSDQALALSYQRLARRGYPEAIASYLSEILSALGVAVKVSIAQRQPLVMEPSPWERFTPAHEETPHRLWVLCEAAYSPDPSLLAPVIAQRLRDLHLENFRDALIVLQVRGETTPDWMLRVDLTPPTLILQEWARWGEITALERLLNQELTRLQLHVRVTLKASTLHLLCHPQEEGGGAPQQDETVAVIQALLNSIGPQGIQGATVYGVRRADAQQQGEVPAWVHWLNLPAGHHPDLAPDATTLAMAGNLSAVSFLLDQLVNPRLEDKLATGGIRVLVLPKSELLHIMTEAPICPSQSQVGVPIAQFLQKLRVAGVKGVRVYGRRAGQKQPLWRYGLDFGVCKSPVPAPTPEFIGAGTGEEELLAATGTLIWRPDLTAQDGKIEIKKPRRRSTPPGKPFAGLTTGVQQILLSSRLFIPQQEEGDALQWQALADQIKGPQASRVRVQKFLAGVTGIVAGTLLAVQLDLTLGQWLQASSEEVPGTVAENSKTEVSTVPELSPDTPPENSTELDHSGFTQAVAAELPCAPGPSSCHLPELNYPSFRSEQLDQQLVRYQQYIHRLQRPPDILIIGSSRALRGIDPQVLEEALAAQGYPGLKAYNFGINGATAQVVDLIVREIIPPQQLPSLILFADGVRAINSGRVDLTFQTIQESEGYQALRAGTFPLQVSEKTVAVAAPWWQFWLQGYQTLAHTWKNALNNLSETYPQREELKTRLLSGASFWQTITDPEDDVKLKKQQSLHPQQLPVARQLHSAAIAVHQRLQESEFLPSPESESHQFYGNGFLAISVQFDPNTYYQKYAQVSGDYDRDYASFQLGGRQTVALRNLVEFTQSQGIKMIFVNLPLTDDYLDTVRQNYEQEFESYMEDLEILLKGFTFRNFNDLWPQRVDYFSDPSHLNRYGAIAVAQHLAKDRFIPWSKGLTQSNSY